MLPLTTAGAAAAAAAAAIASCVASDLWLLVIELCVTRASLCQLWCGRTQRGAAAQEGHAAFVAAGATAIAQVARGAAARVFGEKPTAQACFILNFQGDQGGA